MYRSHAHPSEFDWTEVYPTYDNTKVVEILDIKCGHGGILVSLSTMFPETLILGVDIHKNVFDFVIRRIKSLQERYDDKYRNIGILRANVRKDLPNYFMKGQIKKMIFRFPEALYKYKNKRSIIVNSISISDYAYVLADQGLLYAVLEDRDVFMYVVKAFKEDHQFKQVTHAELQQDPLVKTIITAATKGCRLLNPYIAVFRRVTVTVE